MLNLAAAAGLFVALHLFPSTPLRSALVRRLSQAGYLILFSLLSIVSLAWLVLAFEAAPYGEKLWAMPLGWLWLKAVLVLFALILITGGYLTPNPSLPGAGRFLARPNAAQGVFAITRHPLMWGIAIWAFAHLLTEGTLRAALFFGALVLVALPGAWLQERRKRKELGAGWADFEARTSFLPFAALLSGRTRLSMKEFGWWRLAIAIAGFAVILHFHAALFGAQPLPVAM
jgi:uncharacterized membrane protein